MGEDNGALMSFVRRVGVVAIALTAVITVSNTLGSIIMRQAMVPITTEIQRQISLEAQARSAADDRISASMVELSSDRIAILAVMSAPTGSERMRMMNKLRAKWAK